MEFVIVILLVIIAVEPSEKLYMRYKNWEHRRKIHADWIKNQHE